MDLLIFLVGFISVFSKKIEWPLLSILTFTTKYYGFGPFFEKYNYINNPINWGLLLAILLFIKHFNLKK